MLDDSTCTYSRIFLLPTRSFVPLYCLISGVFSISLPARQFLFAASSHMLSFGTKEHPLRRRKALKPSPIIFLQILLWVVNGGEGNLTALMMPKLAKGIFWKMPTLFCGRLN